MYNLARGGKLLDSFLFLCLLFAAVLLVITAKQLSSEPTLAVEEPRCLVIDPGHGGIDGGAIAFNGIKESDINLSIGLKLRSLADLLGIPTVMTREDDSVCSEQDSYSEHEDLVRRTEVINSSPNGVLISIHQNYYPTSQPSGAQVLYAAGENSRAFGELTQSYLVSTLQPGNRRLSEPASKKLYITSHVSCPAILVECGFLSNLTDLELLSQDTYQSSLAAVLIVSYLHFVTQEAFI